MKHFWRTILASDAARSYRGKALLLLASPFLNLPLYVPAAFISRLGYYLLERLTADHTLRLLLSIGVFLAATPLCWVLLRAIRRAMTKLPLWWRLPCQLLFSGYICWSYGLPGYAAAGKLFPGNMTMMLLGMALTCLPGCLWYSLRVGIFSPALLFSRMEDMKRALAGNARTPQR